MPTIVAELFMSLDGVVDSPQTWHFPYYNDEMAEVVGSQIAAADTIVLGRRTYEEWASSWPNRGSEVTLADKINSAPKLVASTSLKSVDWRNSTLIDGDVSDALRQLKSGPGGEIAVIGSGTLVGSLLHDRVLDELRLLVHPIVVGSGKRLFEDAVGRVPLKLVDSRTFRTGVLYLTYEPADR
jgi:dihydrofolate reductase